MMGRGNRRAVVGLLLSGGLDSCILLGRWLTEGKAVQPFYVRSQLVWERQELAAVERFARAVGSPGLCPLVVLDMPLVDLYGEHWSVTGRGTPDAASRDEAVYLPGRNAILTLKPALWCQMHGISELAMAVLAGNPFPDATEEFFEQLGATLQQATGQPIRLQCPFSRLTKAEIMAEGVGMPLGLTFSCIAPVGPLHCGQCNKCAERHAAFLAAGHADPTDYSRPAWQTV